MWDYELRFPHKRPGGPDRDDKLYIYIYPSSTLAGRSDVGGDEDARKKDATTYIIYILAAASAVALAILKPCLGVRR